MQSTHTEFGHVYRIEYRCVDIKGQTIESFDLKRYAILYRLHDPNVYRIDVYHHYGTRKAPLDIKFYKTAWKRPKLKAYLPKQRKKNA